MITAKDKEVLWAMYSAGMEYSAAHGRGVPDHRQTFLAGVEAGLRLAERGAQNGKRRLKKK